MVNQENEAKAIVYTECYLAFLDILGMKSWVGKSAVHSDVLSSLIATLTSLANNQTKNANHGDGILFSRNVAENTWRHWKLQVRVFSDSIVLFVPVESEGLSWLLGKVRYLNDALICAGYLMRGAVVLGDMYWEEEWSPPSTIGQLSDANVSCDKSLGMGFITVGPAIVEAYRLESEVAIYPRVLLSKRLHGHVGTIAHRAPSHTLNFVSWNSKTFPLSDGGTVSDGLTLLDFIRTDVDGEFFLHVLCEHIDRYDNGRPVGQHGMIQHARVTHEGWLETVYEFLFGQLSTHKGKSAYAKYRWLARYYNDCRTSQTLPALMVYEDSLWLRMRKRVCDYLRNCCKLGA